MRSRHSLRRPGIVLVLALASSLAEGGQLSREEALAAAFPGASITSERVFLTHEEKRRAGQLAGAELSSALVARYLARRDGRLIGRAYVDTHVVRTKRESLLVSLGPDGRVRRIDATAFLEPAEYAASAAWLRQYEGRALEGELTLRRAIRPIAGATLTARAVHDAVRRVLAVDRLLQERGGKR